MNDKTRVELLLAGSLQYTTVSERALIQALAALKAEHARLREAAERAWSALADIPNDRSTLSYKTAWQNNAHEVERLLAAALDSGKGESLAELAALKAAHQRLREAAERAEQSLAVISGIPARITRERLRAALDSGKDAP